MQALRFTAKGPSRRRRRCPELQLYALAAAVMFGAITFVEMIALPDRAKTTENASVCVDVLGNDAHLEGKTFSLRRIDAGPPMGRGTADITGSCIDYDLAGALDALVEGKTETVTLDYSIVDGDQREASARLTVTIKGKKTSRYDVGRALDRLTKGAIPTSLVIVKKPPGKNGNGVRDPCPCTTRPSSDVMKLQEALLRNGGDPGPIDGICGPQTCSAFAKWLELPFPGAGPHQRHARTQPWPWPRPWPSPRKPSWSPPGASLCWLPGFMQFFATRWGPINGRPHVGWLAAGYTADNCVTAEETAEEEDELWRVGLENDRFVDQGVPPVETSTVTVSPPHDQARRHHERRGPGMHTHGHERKRHHGKGSRGKKKRH